jgi:NADH dehydrogenase [ubiquinone] 1 alpha subcomplex assembly factor 2
MQWLRHTRFEPPTVQEQQAELQRQQNIKLLAARADERWASKPSALDAPDKQQPIQMLESRDPKSGVVQTNAEQELRSRGPESRSAEASQQEEERPKNDMRPDVTPGAEAPQEESGLTEEAPMFKAKKKMRPNKAPKEDSPWKQVVAGNPGDDWQPKAWTPPPRRRG